MDTQQVPFERQIFVCTNEAKGENTSCSDHQGLFIFQELRKIAKERNLHPQIRVAQAKCLGKCSLGCNIMVYPDNEWYSHVTPEDIPTIAEKYLTI